MNIGITATRKGLTEPQLERLKLEVLNVQVEEQPHTFHHGDCVKGDEAFHNLVKGWGRVVVHPPLDPKLRAFCNDGVIVVIRKPKPYMMRNNDIAHEVDILFVCPKGFKQELRSGTWSTFRMAKAIGKTVVIIYPDGSVG